MPFLDESVAALEQVLVTGLYPVGRTSDTLVVIKRRILAMAGNDQAGERDKKQVADVLKANGDDNCDVDPVDLRWTRIEISVSETKTAWARICCYTDCTHLNDNDEHGVWVVKLRAGLLHKYRVDLDPIFDRLWREAEEISPGCGCATFIAANRVMWCRVEAQAAEWAIEKLQTRARTYGIY